MLTKEEIEGKLRAQLALELGCRPEYAGLRGFLITRDAHGLYRKFGYEVVAGRVMVKKNEGSGGAC